VSMSVSESIADGWVRQRNKLLESGNLVSGEGKYVFAKDTLFSSPSAASSVILGRQSAGPIEWIDENGKTYKENQQSD
jgi:hypothetical protein